MNQKVRSALDTVFKFATHDYDSMDAQEAYDAFKILTEALGEPEYVNEQFKFYLKLKFVGDESEKK